MRPAQRALGHTRLDADPASTPATTTPARWPPCAATTCCWSTRSATASTWWPRKGRWSTSATACWPLSPEAGAWDELEGVVRRGPPLRHHRHRRRPGRRRWRRAAPSAAARGGRAAAPGRGAARPRDWLDDQLGRQPARCKQARRAPGGPVDHQVGRSEQLRRRLAPAHPDPHGLHARAGQLVEGVEGRQVAHVVAQEATPPQAVGQLQQRRCPCPRRWAGAARRTCGPGARRDPTGRLVLGPGARRPRALGPARGSAG